MLLLRSGRNLKKANHKDFLPVITRIEEIIETQQFTGATIGEFNANIIARKLGINDKITLTQEKIIKDISKSQIIEILQDE